MKASVPEKAVKLNTASKLFDPGQFVLRVLSGEPSPFLVATEEYCMNKSVRYTVFDSDLEPVHKIETHKHKANLYYLPQDCFILNEKGIMGFDIEMKLFSCKTQVTEDELIVDIDEVPERLAELEGQIDEKFALLRDSFYESALNAALGRINKTDYRYELAMQNTLADIEKTKFLDITEENGLNFRLIGELTGSAGFLHSNEEVKVRRESGFFSPLFQDENIWEKELLMIKKYGEKDMFTVERPMELLHDIKSRFWLKTQVLYRYPQDKKRLSEELPMLYDQVTERAEKWKEFEQLTEEPKPNKLGDLDIMMPCKYMKKTNWFMSNDIFHFTFTGHKGFTPNITAERSMIMCADYAASVLSFGGKEYFAVFKSKNKKRFGKNVYAHHVFHKLVPVADTVAESESAAVPKLYKILFAKYQFNLHRNKIKPYVVTEEVFSAFELSNDLANEDKSDCVLADIFDFTRT